MISRGRGPVSVILRRRGSIPIEAGVVRAVVATRLGVVPGAVVVPGVRGTVCAGWGPGVVGAVAVAVGAAVAVVGAGGRRGRGVVVWARGGGAWDAG